MLRLLCDLRHVVSYGNKRAWFHFVILKSGYIGKLHVWFHLVILKSGYIGKLEVWCHLMISVCWSNSYIEAKEIALLLN